jgi:hypothetical protein
MRIMARAARLAHAGLKLACNASALPLEMRGSAATYLLVTSGNVPAAVVAEALDCSRQNVAKLVRTMEMRRDDPLIDRELERLETGIRDEI